jgi:hypothetical protein
MREHNEEYEIALSLLNEGASELEALNVLRESSLPDELLENIVADAASDLSLRSASKLREGYPRAHIKKDVKDAFVKEIISIKDPVKRKAEFDKVMEEIKEINIKQYMKSHPEESKATAEASTPPMGSPNTETI